MRAVANGPPPVVKIGSRISKAEIDVRHDKKAECIGRIAAAAYQRLAQQQHLAVFLLHNNDWGSMEPLNGAACRVYDLVLARAEELSATTLVALSQIAGPALEQVSQMTAADAPVRRKIVRSGVQITLGFASR